MVRPILALVLIAGVLGAPASAQQRGRWRQPPVILGPPQPNVVLILADDLGVDMVSGYGESAEAPCTPNIDRLAETGLLFRNAWAFPLCSPTRAQLLTGRYGFRNGIGRTTVPDTNVGGLSLDTAILPKAMIGYESSAVGKWHLSGNGHGPLHPLRLGFGYYAGPLWNAGAYTKGSYRNWDKDVNGDVFHTTAYMTTDTADDAIKRAAEMQPPWFLYVSFNAPHVPAHLPPEELCQLGGLCAEPSCPGTPESPTSTKVRAVTEALDSEIGRLLDEIYRIDPDVVVIFVGDNGTFAGATLPPFDRDHAKATLYEGGVNVPLIVNMPGMATGESDALVSTVDLHATILELAGLSAVTEDSVSMVPYLTGMAQTSIRDTVYSEKFVPNFNPSQTKFDPVQHTRAVRNMRFKLIRTKAFQQTSDEFYDLDADPFEAIDLMPPQAGVEEDNYAMLVAELEALGVD